MDSQAAFFCPILVGDCVVFFLFLFANELTSGLIYGSILATGCLVKLGTACVNLLYENHFAALFVDFAFYRFNITFSDL